MRAFTLASALLVLLLCSSATTWCLEVGELPYGAAVVGSLEGGVASQTWFYQVTNTSAEDKYTIWLLAVEVDEGCDVLSAISPGGWTADWTSAPHFVMWQSDFPASEVPKDSTLSGFGIEYSTTPAYQMYSAMFNNADNPSDTPVDFGDVRTGAVPEPASLATVLVGFSSLMGIALRRKR